MLFSKFFIGTFKAHYVGHNLPYLSSTYVLATALNAHHCTDWFQNMYLMILTFFFTGGAVSTYIAIKNIVYDENGIQVGQCYLVGDSEISAGSGGH